MAYAQEGLKLISTGGAVGTGAGSAKNLYSYVTNDTRATVEADAYFDGVNGDPLLAGDIIIASMDVDGTPDSEVYMVNVGGGDVSLRKAGGEFFISGYDADIHTNSQIYIPVPADCYLEAVYVAINAALQTDVTLTVKTTDGTAGTIALESSGSAAGDTGSLTSPLHTTLDAGETIEIESSGAASGVVEAFYTIVCRRR